MTHYDPGAPLRPFQQQRQRLITLCEHFLPIIERVHLIAIGAEVYQQLRYLQAFHLQVMIVGECNRGKSTVMNALLGEPLLPAYPTPTTALLTEIKWGEQLRALLHYRSHGDREATAPRNIPITDLEAYLVIHRHDENRYERMELFWPLPVCRSGIVFIDTPALDDQEMYLDVTWRFLCEADAVIFVTGSNAVPSREEGLLIDRLRSVGHEAIFFLCNGIDLVPCGQQPLVKQQRIAQLAPLTPYGDQLLFFTAAKSALKVRSWSAGESCVSDMCEVAELLYRFLARQGNAKLLLAVIRLKSLMHAIRPALFRYGALQAGETTLPQTAFLHALDVQMETRRQRCSGRCGQICSNICEALGAKTISFYQDVARDVADYPCPPLPQEPVCSWQLFVGDRQERLVKEIVTSFTTQVHATFRAWVSSQVRPLLYKALRRIAREIDAYVVHSMHELAEERRAFWNVVLNHGEHMDASHHASFAGSLIQRTITRIVSAIITEMCFHWHSSVLIPRLLETIAIQALLKRRVSQEEALAIVKRVYQQMLLQSLQQRITAITSVIERELHQFQRELAQCFQQERDILRVHLNRSAQQHEQMDELESMLGVLTDELQAIEHELTGALLREAFP